MFWAVPGQRLLSSLWLWATNKTTKIGIFCHFGPNIYVFGPFWYCARPKTMGTRCMVCFLICEYQNFCSFSKKNWGFGPKTALLAPKYALLGLWCPCQLIWCPIGWWLWRAGCISQDIPLLYDYSNEKSIYRSPENCTIVHIWSEKLLRQTSCAMLAMCASQCKSVLFLCRRLCNS